MHGTVDIDVLVAWNRNTLAGAEQALNEIGRVSRLSITAEGILRFRCEHLENRNLVARTFHNPADLFEQVAIIITNVLYQTQKRRRMQSWLVDPDNGCDN